MDRLADRDRQTFRQPGHIEIDRWTGQDRNRHVYKLTDKQTEV